MAHFAELDENNMVLRVLVVPDEEEHRGEEFLRDDLNLGGKWIQTSYNGNIRKMFAGIGYTYHQELDIFIPPKPFPSWILNTDKGEWESPIPAPEIDPYTHALGWDEENQKWNITNNIAILPSNE